MPADSPSFEIPAEVEPLPKTAFDRLIWPLLLMLAWLAFELTANATLSLVLACLKFGLNDFRTAWWLWRVDPHRPRARACASFYAASGVWKTTVVPLLAMLVIAIVWAMIAPHDLRKEHPISTQLLLSLKVGLCAATVLIVLALVAVTLSLAARWRVWVHPNLHRSRTAGHWPPQFHPADRTKANYAFLIMLTAIFAVVVLGPVLSLLVINLLFDPPAALRRIFALIVVFGFPMFGGTTFGLLRGRLFARSPWECWPESIRQLETPGPHYVDLITSTASTFQANL